MDVENTHDAGAGLASIWSCRGPVPLVGTCTRRLVPFINSVTMAAVPPASRTRSLMLTSPSPLAAVTGLGDVKSPAVVGDRQFRAIADAFEADVGVAGVRVRDDIAHTLLRHPI